MKVADVMTRDVVTLDPKDTLRNASEVLRSNEISGAPVVSNGKVIGVLSEGDVVKALRTGDIGYELWFPSPFEIVEVPLRNLIKWRKLKEELEERDELHVEDVMTSSVKKIGPDESFEEAAEKMSRHRINRLPVMDDDGNLVGIVTREDILKGVMKG